MEAIKSFMTKIIIAAEYLDLEQNSTGYFWSKIIGGLRHTALDLAVVRPSWLNKYDSFTGNTSLIKRVIKQIVISVDLAFGIARVCKRGGVVFTGTNPTILLGIMPILRAVFGINWILLVHDVFPDNLQAAGIMKKGNPLYSTIASYFSWVYAKPDKLLCIGRDMQSLIHSKTNGKAKTEYIPNWANGDEVFPLDRNDLNFFSENHWDGHVVFQFFGNIGRVQGVQNLLNAIALVKSVNAAFVFIGGGALVPLVKKFINENTHKSVKLLGPVSFENRNECLALCDVALVSLEAGMLGIGVPSKTYFSLAAGKPILAAVDAQSEIGLMLAEFPTGWRCDPDNPQELADMIDLICQDPNAIHDLRPRVVFMENYSEDVVLGKIINTIETVALASSSNRSSIQN